MPAPSSFKHLSSLGLICMAALGQGCSVLEPFMSGGDEALMPVPVDDRPDQISEADKGALLNLRDEGHLSEAEYQSAIELVADEVATQGWMSQVDWPASLTLDFDGAFDGLGGLGWTGDLEARSVVLRGLLVRSKSPMTGASFRAPLGQATVTVGNLFVYGCTNLGGGWGEGGGTGAPVTYGFYGAGVRWPRDAGGAYVLRAGLTVVEDHNGSFFFYDQGRHLAFEYEKPISEKVLLTVGGSVTSYHFGLSDTTPTASIDYRLTDVVLLTASYSSMYAQELFGFGLALDLGF